jgi:hypothetical protein
MTSNKLTLRYLVCDHDTIQPRTICSSYTVRPVAKWAHVNDSDTLSALYHEIETQLGAPVDIILWKVCKVDNQNSFASRMLIYQ